MRKKAKQNLRAKRLTSKRNRKKANKPARLEWKAEQHVLYLEREEQRRIQKLLDDAKARNKRQKEREAKKAKVEIKKIEGQALPVVNNEK